MNNVTVLLVLILMLGACSNDTLKEVNPRLTESNTKLESLKLDFGISLMSSFAQSQKLRQIIKNESLKKMNGDYDVLYALIKYQEIENGKTVEQMLQSNFKDKTSYDDLLKELPTLTIMVPELPNNSFSAELWNTKDVPAVAIKNDRENDVKVVLNTGEVVTIEGKYTPGFPIVVLKKNESIVDESYPGFASLKTDQLTSKDGLKFKFIDNYVSRSRNDLAARTVPVNQLDPKIIQASTIYDQQYPNINGWHRDYIYYNITPTTPVGPFDYDFQECITTFRMSNPNPMISYNTLTNSNVGSEADPSINYGWNITSHWTSGNYHFKVKILFNNKGGIGTEDVKDVYLSPSQLFDIQYEVRYYFGLGTLFMPNKFESKSVNLNLPLFNWDLNQYASTIKITIEEVDNLVENTITTTDNVKYATNFGIDPTTGIIVKLGLKFGASLEESRSKSYTIKYAEGNDDMGSVIINFADKVIIGRNANDTYNTREYDNTVFSISVEPKRVQ